MKYIPLFFLIWFSKFALAETVQKYGLDFCSYEVEKEQRTGLVLTPNKPFILNEGFTLSFDAYFKRTYYTFGYVIRIIGRNDEHIDLMLNLRSEDVSPKLTATNKTGEVLCDFILKDIDSGIEQWMNIEINVNAKKRSIRFKVNEAVCEKQASFLDAMSEVDFVFGKNDEGIYQTSDIPAMLIRDVKIKNASGKLLHHWQLSKHADRKVYDIIGNSPAVCENGKWIIDKFAFWEKKIEFTAGLYPQICFNSEDNTIAMADERCFYLYNASNNNLKTDSVRNRLPSKSYANQLL